MYAIIGRYKVRMGESGLILKHATGISFDLTTEETLVLLDFLSPYRQALLAMRSNTEVDTETLSRFVPHDDDVL